MTTRTLYLFPDTNLFIQCHPLEDLDWTVWKEFDQVHLVVARPVQREIDNQKNCGSDRVGSRARDTSSMFRTIITGEMGFKLIREAGPEVRLMIDPSCVPRRDLADRLDLEKPDDALVGCVHAFLALHAGADARVLTHDSGPMATAKMLGIPFVPIPDVWRLPPENTEPEKKSARLESELARLKKAEPQFELKCLNPEGNEISRIEFEHVFYQPLQREEVIELTGLLLAHFPIITDFGSREPAEREPKMPALGILGRKEIYIPATDEVIAKYVDTSYPVWLEKCERFLSDIHAELQRDAGPPPFRFAATNAGTRPGSDVLVTIESKGNFQIQAPADNDDADDDEEENSAIEKRLELPNPPKAPAGEWVMGFGSNPAKFGALARQAAMLGSIRTISPFWQDPFRQDMRLLKNLEPFSTRRDPNGFYWKPKRPAVPVDTFNYECAQWRHGFGDEFFEGHLSFDRGQETIAGALECRIHAENLSSTKRLTIPVRGIIRYESSRRLADELIADLVRRRR